MVGQKNFTKMVKIYNDDYTGNFFNVLTCASFTLFLDSMAFVSHALHPLAVTRLSALKNTAFLAHQNAHSVCMD